MWEMSARLRKRGAKGAIAAAIPLTLCSLLLLPTIADATPTGSITGTVTAPQGFGILATICAISSNGEEDCTTMLAASINGNSPGAYRITGLTGGEYKVSFAARCSVEPCAENAFPPSYYDDQISLAKAAPVEVSAGATLEGIDATIETIGQRQVREYLENEESALPSEQRGGVGPGAIEPQPVNKQIEEEFYAHPPWEKASSTPASSTAASPPPAVGIALAARGAAVKGHGVEIALRCTGAGACTGSLALVGKLTDKTYVKRDGKRVAIKQVRKILLGTAGFSLGAGASETLSVHLTRLGQAMTRIASKKALDVELTGSGVKSGALILK